MSSDQGGGASAIQGSYRFVPTVEPRSWPKAALHVEFLAATPRRFRVWVGRQAVYSDGPAFWVYEDESLVFAGQGLSSLPAKLRTMVFPDEELWNAASSAVADGHADVDQNLGIVTRLESEAGTCRIQGGGRVEVTERDFAPTRQPWSGNYVGCTGYIVVEADREPSGNELAGAHLEVNAIGVGFIEHAPDGLTLTEAEAWVRERAAQVVVSVDHPDGTRTHVRRSGWPPEASATAP